MAIGFDDIITPSSGFAVAGDMAPKIVSSYQQGMADYAQGQAAMAKLKELEHKIAMDDLEMRQKIEDRPLERLGKMQKINVIPDEVGDDDYTQAIQEVLGDKKTATPEEAQKIQARAEEIALERAPKMNPNDPSSWLKDVNDNARILSDTEAEMRKYQSQEASKMQREFLKAQYQADRDDARAKATDARLEKTLEQMGIRQEKALAQSDKNTKAVITAAGARQASQQSFVDEQTRTKEARTALEGMKKRYRAFSRPESNPGVAKRIVADYQSLLEKGSPEVSKQAYKAYEGVLSRAGFKEPGGGGQRPAPAPTPAPKKPGAPQAERRMLPNGRVVEKRNGRWFPVKN